MAEQTLNIPQIIAVVIVGFLAIRWFLSSGSQSSSSNGGRQINPAHVDQVLQMFPQLDRRNVMWDLQRNGGSVSATTERVLGGRGLDAVRSFGVCLVFARPRRSISPACLSIAFPDTDKSAGPTIIPASNTTLNTATSHRDVVQCYNPNQGITSRPNHEIQPFFKVVCSDWRGHGRCFPASRRQSKQQTIVVSEQKRALGPAEEKTRRDDLSSTTENGSQR